MPSKRASLTIIKGDGWRKYVPAMPNKQMRALGTVAVGKLEGALVLDMSSNLYVLIDRTGAWYEVDQGKVRTALDAEQ